MIYFCEDCGKKNLLLPAQLKDGKVKFRCSSCRYLNSYNIKTPAATHLKKAESFLKKIQASPEIIGSFLFHQKKGVLQNNMPGILLESDLMILGNILTKNFLAGSSLYPVREMALVISGKNMIVKMFDDLAIIIASKTFPLPGNIIALMSGLDSNHSTKTDHHNGH